jgi:hypothetical protein
VIEKIKYLKNLDYVKSNENRIDMLNDLDNLRIKLLSRLDQYLKHKILKRGITSIKLHTPDFIHNTHLRKFKD